MPTCTVVEFSKVLLLLVRAQVTLMKQWPMQVLGHFLDAVWLKLLLAVNEALSELYCLFRFSGLMSFIEFCEKSADTFRPPTRSLYRKNSLSTLCFTLITADHFSCQNLPPVLLIHITEGEFVEYKNSFCQSLEHGKINFIVYMYEQTENFSFHGNVNN